LGFDSGETYKGSEIIQEAENGKVNILIAMSITVKGWASAVGAVLGPWHQ